MNRYKVHQNMIHFRLIILLVLLVIACNISHGQTVHQIWVGADAASMFQVHEFAGFTRDSDVLEFITDGPMDNIRFIKIVTTQSTSWVAWREIEVIGE